MAKENENKEVEIIDEKEDSKEMDMAKEMAKVFASEMKKVKEEEKKEVSQKVVMSNRVKVLEDTRKCGSFKNVAEAHSFAKTFIPRNILEKFMNEKALTTYQNIGTSDDGGSLDPIDAHGILADSVERHNSYVEDTLQVDLFNSVGTFIDYTQTPAAYMIDEGSAITESKAAFTNRTLTQKKICTLVPVTNEVFRFGTLAQIANATFDGMGRSIALKKQHLIFTADGDSDATDGGITGTIPALVAVGASTNNTILQVSGEWTDLDNEKISNAVAQVAGWAKSEKFTWFMNRSAWGAVEGVARSLGGNNYFVQTGQRPVFKLYGYDVKFVDSMPSSWSQGEIGMLFGDLSSVTATGTDGRIYIDSSDSFYFQQDTTVLRAIQHLAVNVYSPGTSSATAGIVALRFNGDS